MVHTSGVRLLSADFVLFWHRNGVPDIVAGENLLVNDKRLRRWSGAQYRGEHDDKTAAHSPVNTHARETGRHGSSRSLEGNAGWLDDGGLKGREIYDSRRQGDPVSSVIGTERVMPGWNDGIVGMQPGGRRLLRLPPALGYGAKGVQGIVPPDASLIFIIELLDLKKHAAH